LEKFHKGAVGERHQGRSYEFPVIAVMGDELPDLPVMREVALPGTGEQELGAGLRVLLEQDDPTARTGRMDRTEETGRPGTDHDTISFHLDHTYRSMTGHC